MSEIDANYAVRNLIDSAFSHLTWYEDLCEETGFKGISQIWKEEPAWYFWMKPCPGAFLLRLHAEESLTLGKLLNLSLHYFPARNEESYKHLSADEIRLIGDEDRFDIETSTPRFEAYQQFHDQFIDAEIGCVVDEDNRLQFLFFSTEQVLDHPVYTFIDLLVTALNFQSKQHQGRVVEIQDAGMRTLFLEYSQKALEYFLNEFDLGEAASLVDISSAEMPQQWRRAAHLDAVCTMSGACSCHH